MKIILASASPRRADLLRAAGVDFEVMPSGARELFGCLDPRELVTKNAALKASEIKGLSCGGAVVIGADTVVSVSGETLGKPEDEEDAFSMLSALSGRWHEVYTGLCVMSDGRTETAFELTKVKFRPLSPGEIARYISTGEPMDKAGAYGIQQKGSLLVERIEGDYFNVVGLPLCLLSNMLAVFGIALL